MSPLWTGADIAAATGGELRGDFTATGISIDSRTLERGDLFVALTDQRDGHEFVEAAFARGAGAALVSHRPKGLDTTAPLVVVDDVLAGLTDLAIAGRARTGAKVAAITGSAGKTSTKDLLRAMLAAQGKTHAAEASYNNHWGVPLTLARMPGDTEFAVMEIGMNHPGEIAPLARLARPDVAIITNVAAAHLEAFESVEEIAREKASIFAGLGPGGIAVINADMETADLVIAKAKGRIATIFTFGESQNCDFQATSITIHEGFTVVEATTPQGPVLFKIGAVGRHFALNGLAALAATSALGADMALAANAAAGWNAPAGRGARETILLDEGLEDSAITLIDDAFNANPASMAAGLGVLAASPVAKAGRRIAVLGDMLELGPDEETLHARIAQDAAMAEIDTVHTVGSLTEHTRAALGPEKRGGHFTNADEMVAAVRELIQPGDVVLVKGSKSSLVSRVVDAIRKLGHPRASMANGDR